MGAPLRLRENDGSLSCTRFGPQEVAMRWGWVFSIVGIGVSASAFAGEPFVQSNDTGGIISWSCEAEAQARAIAAYECARWNKYPRITSVHRRYGDYIGFQCLWSPKDYRY